MAGEYSPPHGCRHSPKQCRSRDKHISTDRVDVFPHVDGILVAVLHCQLSAIVRPGFWVDQNAEQVWRLALELDLEFSRNIVYPGKRQIIRQGAMTGNI